MFCRVILSCLLVSTVTYAEEDLVGDRIVGGSYIDINNRNFQTSVHPCQRFCGGVVISESIVLSAAHCTIDCQVLNIYVAAGSNYGRRGERRNVVQKIEHESFDRRTYNNDVVLLKLDRKYTLETNIGTIELATSLPANGADLIVSGYGALGTNEPLSGSLLSATVQLTNFKTCNASYGGYLTPQMFCAASVGKDSCQGDSGGPITYTSGLSTKLVGIVSFGRKCGDPTHPGVYANVPNLHKWIVKAIKSL